MAQASKIVVPTDFSDASLAALEWAKSFSQDGNVEVHCVTVVQAPTVYLPMMSGAAVDSLPAAEELARITETSLEKFIARHIDEFGAPPVTKVLVGRPADQISDYAEEIGADMIVIASHGHSRLAHLMLGSTAEAVVREARCPVLTVKSP
jgi:nucleotide-binding universal stress UspA family protein